MDRGSITGGLVAPWTLRITQSDLDERCGVRILLLSRLCVALPCRLLRGSWSVHCDLSLGSPLPFLPISLAPSPLFCPGLCTAISQFPRI